MLDVVPIKGMIWNGNRVVLPELQGRHKLDCLVTRGDQAPSKKSQFTDCQIIAVLREDEAGLSVPEPCWTSGIRSATRSGSSTSWTTTIAKGG